MWKSIVICFIFWEQTWGDHETSVGRQHTEAFFKEPRIWVQLILSLTLASIIPTEIVWSLRTIHFQETENNSK